jgi:hypothetical protein
MSLELGNMSTEQQETTLLAEIVRFDSWTGQRTRRFVVRSDVNGRCWYDLTNLGRWEPMPQAHQNVMRNWFTVLSHDDARRVLDEYAAMCQHELWTPHPDEWHLVLTTGDKIIIDWSASGGGLMPMDFPSGIVTDIHKSLVAAVNNQAPIPVPAEYLADLTKVRYTVADSSRTAR